MSDAATTVAAEAQNLPGAAKPAVVLLSGGLDSATVLAVVKAGGFAPHALSIDYGQRHRAELDAAARVSASIGVAAHRVVRVDAGQFGGSALTDASIDVPVDGIGAGIPVTYVPARNTLMLALALGWAEVLGASEIFIGVNAIDYSGYPDCRPAFVAAFEAMANLATRAGVEGQRLHVRADGRACRRCDACRLRRDGFARAGVADPTRYRD